MRDDTAKLLGMEDVIVKKVWDTEREQHIEIELPRRRHSCPEYGQPTEKIHDYRRQRIKDSPAFGMHVYLHLRKRRYVCGHCGKGFYEENSFLPPLPPLPRHQAGHMGLRACAKGGAEETACPMAEVL